MIGRVKVTTSIERSVSLYTPPDKNTYNGKHAAFSIRKENAPFILVQTTGAPVSRFVASHWCLQSLLRQKEFSVFLLLDQRPGYYWAPPGVRSTSALALAKGTTKNIIPIYTCLLVFIYLLWAASAFLMVLLMSGQVAREKAGNYMSSLTLRLL